MRLQVPSNLGPRSTPRGCLEQLHPRIDFRIMTSSSCLAPPSASGGSSRTDPNDEWDVACDYGENERFLLNIFEPFLGPLSEEKCGHCHFLAFSDFALKRATPVENRCKKIGVPDALDALW